MKRLPLFRKIRESFKSPPEITVRLFLISVGAFFITSLMSTMGNVIDALIVGHTMKTADVAAMSLTSPVWFLASFIYGVLNAGAQPRCTVELARGDQEKAREIFSMALISTTALAAVLGVFLLFGSGTCARLLGAAETSAEFERVKAYLRGISFGLPALTAGSSITMSMNLEGARRWTLGYALALTVSNIALDLLVAFTHGDMLMLGVTTSVAYWASLGVYLLYYHSNKDILLRPRLCRVSLPLVGTMILFGLPSGVRRITSLIRSVYLNHVLAASATSYGIAAYNVQVQVANLARNLFTAIGLTMAMMLAFYYSEENKDGLRYTVMIALFLELVFGLALTVLLQNNEIAHMISWFYLGNEMESRYIADIAIYFYGYGLLGQALAVLFAVYLQNTRKPFLSNLVYILSDVVLMIAFVEHRYAGLDPGVFETRRISMIFLQVARAQNAMLWVIPLIILLSALVNVLLKKKPDSFTHMVLMLPKGYGSMKGHELAASPRTLKQVAEFSEKAYHFCLSHGAGQREAYAVSLAAEEMSANIIKHGFKDKGRRRMELRLIHKENFFLLRIRDNSHIFDPIKKMASVADIQDPSRYIGLRMVMKMASDVSYTSTLKLNNLVIRIDMPQMP